MNRSIVPSSKRILVDDADARISYKGAWEVLQGEEFSGGGNNGPPFRTTLHGVRPQTTGHFLFEYEGSSVEVWGTIPVEGDFDADWECLVDGLPAQRVDVPFPRSQHRQKLCEWRSNAFGKHILFVNATSRENSRFLVDYISYSPSPSQDALTGIIQVPHDDPDFIFEGPRWRVQEGAGRRTRLPGNSAKLEFIGTSLEWYGFRAGGFPSNQSTGSFSIDGVLPTDFIYSGLGEESAETQFNQLLFKTPQLTSGPHSLTVTHGGPNAPLTLSYVIVENDRDGPGTFTTNATPSPPSSGGAEASDAQVGATAASTNAGAVAGGVIGGLCALGLLALLVYLFIRWRRKTQLPMIQPLPGFVKPESTAPLEIDLVNTRRSDELYPPSRPGSYGFQHTRRRSNARRFNPEVRSTISSVHLNPPPVQHAPPSTTNTGYDNDSIAEVERPAASNDTREDLNPYAAGYPYASMQLSDYQNLVQATKHQEARAKANQQRDSYM